MNVWDDVQAERERAHRKHGDTSMEALPGGAVSDPINPAHYKQGGVEVISAIEAWGLGFCLGNTVKYVARAGKKDSAKTIEDLRKAAWYLQREINRLDK